MPSLPTLQAILFAAVLSSSTLLSHAQAHEMDGIDHVHLSNGVAQILEPIPGLASTLIAPPAQTAAVNVAQPHQASGVASLVIQAVLIVSVIVLVLVVARAGSIKRGRQR